MSCAHHLYTCARSAQGTLMSQFPVASDLNATWTFIQPGLEFILGALGDVGVTSKMYMNCYTAIYNYCTNKSRHGATPAMATSGAGTNLYSGKEIYHKLDEYLVEFISSLEKDPDESFLEFYVRKWSRFTIGAGYLNNVFDYMNRYWVQKERSDGRRDVFDVSTLALLKWKTHMFNNNKETLIREILDQTERQRNNELVNTSSLSTAIKSLVFLGIDVQDLKKSNLVVYINHFELGFLAETKEYYRKESAQFLQHHNVVDYMRKCETRLAEEISRSNNYLEDHTKKPLLDTLNQALIEDHATEMYNEFLGLLEQNETEHIQRMYKLLSMVPATLQPLADTLEKYIKEEAAKAIDDIKKQNEQHMQEASNTEAGKTKKSSPGATNPRTYVHLLISIYLRFNEVISVAFSKDPIFIKSLDNACRFFVNKNSIATPTPKSHCKTPDLLARYADSYLKGSSKESDTTVLNPDILMIIFKFIEDKDAFEEHYRRLLAKRLINSNTKSDELEESIIQRLQEENSLEYTSKMTKMFQDMKASEDLKRLMRSEIANTDNTIKDFTPLILAQSMWPFTHMEEYKLNLAPELMPSFEMLLLLYKEKHSGRQLKWLWNHGKSEIKANLSRKGKPPFLFTVTNVQLMILLAYNKTNVHTFQSLLEIVGVAKHTFEAHLTPFVKYKLLEQTPNGSGDFNQPDTKFTIVEEYKSKKLRVNFVSSIKSEQKQEDVDANREIDESRKNFLSACIVRIMKARKQIKHNELVNEVATQALTRFRARIIDIKKVIDYLIEKEYLRRMENDMYEYLA